MKQAPDRKPLLVVAALLAAIALIALAVSITSTRPSGDEESRETVQSETGTLSQHLPADEIVQSIDFQASSGDMRLITFNAEVLFDVHEGDLSAVYVVVGISCTPLTGNTETSSVSATENLLHNDERNIGVNFLYTASRDGGQRCNARFRTPNWNPDKASSSIDMSTTLEVSPTGHRVSSAAAQAEDPIIIKAGEDVEILRGSLPLARHPGEVLSAATVHATSCTITNGSKDGTHHNLCTQDMVNRAGSEVTVEATAWGLENGNVCATQSIIREKIEVGYRMHHVLFSTESHVVVHEPSRCGDSMGYSVTVKNQGPAPLLVHRGTSSMSLLQTR